MKPMIIALMFAGLAVAMFEPLTATGNARWGDGYGLLLNGGAALALMLLGGVISVVFLLQRRRTASGEVQK